MAVYKIHLITKSFLAAKKIISNPGSNNNLVSTSVDEFYLNVLNHNDGYFKYKNLFALSHSISAYS